MPLSAGHGRTTLSEINVTPLVDVMLVLLVIFMITVPVIQSGIEVDVPFTHSTRQLTRALTVVNVDRANNVYIGDQRTNLHTIAADLKKHVSASDPEIYVRADQHVPWGTLALVMDAIQQGGYTKVNLVTQPYQTPPTGPPK